MKIKQINALSMTVCLLSLILSASALEPSRYGQSSLVVLEGLPETVAELENLIPKMRGAGTAFRAITIYTYEVFQKEVVGAESPHIKWAKPFISGPFKEVLFIRAPGQWIAPECRDPVEICQRLDIEKARYGWTAPSLYAGDTKGKAKHLWVTTIYQPVWDRLLNQLKTAHPQVIVLPLARLGFPYMSPECEQELSRLVHEGAGLVLVAPPPDWLSRKNVGSMENEIDDGKHSVFMDKIFPIELTKGESSLKSIVPVGRHFITDGVAFKRFAPAQFPAGTLRPGAQVIAKTEDGLPAVIVSEYGKGRVVSIPWNSKDCHDWGSYIPLWDRNDFANEPQRYWEQEFALLVRAMLWAGRQEPDVDLEVSAPERFKWGETAIITLTAVNRGRARKLSVETTLRNVDYAEVVTVKDDLSLKAGEKKTVFLDLLNKKLLEQAPAKNIVPAGNYTLDILLRDQKDKAVNFASIALQGESPLNLSLTSDKTYCKEGDKITATLRTKANEGITIASKETVVRWLVTDNWNRLRACETQAMDDLSRERTVSFTHVLNHVKGNPALITVQILVDGSLVQQASLPVYLPQYGRRDWGKDFMPMMWGGDLGYNRGMFYQYIRAIGYRGIYAQGDESYPDIARADLAIQNAAAGIGGVNASVEYKKNENNQHWWYSKPEDERMKAFDRIAKSVAIRKYGATNLILCDEPGLEDREGEEGEVDYSPVSIAEFRKRLKVEFKTIEALNEQWGSAYKSWDEVNPLLSSQTKGLENLGPWLDFRSFMDTLYAENWWKHLDAYEKACGFPLEVGVDGTWGFSRGIINTGMDYAKLSGPKAGLFDYGYYTMPWVPNCQSFKIYESFCGGICGSLGDAHPWLLFNGGLCSISFDGATYYSGCGALTRNGQQQKEKNERLVRGVGKLLAGSRRETPEVGILYTHPSYLLHRILERNGKGIGTNEHQQSRYALERMCWDLQVPFRYVNYLILPEDLKGIKLLFLTGCQALSKEQGEVLNKFVQNGGILMADIAPGIYDLHGKPYSPGEGPVDKLFGITRDTLNIIRTTPWWDMGFTVEPLEELGTAGEWDSSGVYERSLKVTDARSLGVNYNIAGLVAEKYKEGMCPAFVYKKTGKGFTLLLNFLLDQYASAPGFQPGGSSNPLRVIRGLTEKAGIQESSVIKNGYDKLTFYYVNRFYQDGGMEHFTVMPQFEVGQLRRNPDKVTVDFGRKGHLYDVSAGSYLGEGSSATVTVTAGPEGAKIISLLPYKVEKVTLSGPEKATAGQVVNVECVVQSTVTAVLDHCLRVDVMAPDGTKVLPYSGNFWAPKGQLNLEIPFALNDPIGNWTISVRDTVSGVTGKMPLKLIK